MSKRKRLAILRDIGSSDGKVRGWHRGCAAAVKPAIGSSYKALFLDEYGRVCCNECGAEDLGK